MIDESELRAQFESDPGSEAFFTLSALLQEQGRIQEAVLICLKGLSSSPAHERGRLLLARLYFELGFVPFAADELRKLCAQLPDNEQLRKLFRFLSPSETVLPSSAPVEKGEERGKVMAEADFDVDDL